MRPDRAHWGWTDPARGFLILVAAVLAMSLAWASRGRDGAGTHLPSLVVDANSAPAEVLVALPGLGPVLAGRIVEVRSAAPFRTIDDLDRRVKGIGPVTVARLRPFLRFGPPDRPTTNHP